MAILGTFGGLQIVSTPITRLPGQPAPLGKGPRSIEYTATDLVGASRGTYTGQMQTFNWRSSWLLQTVSFPPMTRAEADPWIAFLKDTEGTANVFQLPNPLTERPKGTVTSASLPVVDGAVSANNQPQAQLLSTKGWKPGQARLLLPNDSIQVGYRLYSVLDTVNADSNGKAVLRVWPRLREQPADGATIIVSNTQGLYRLAGNDRKWSLNENRTYGLTFNVVEALPTA